MNTKREHWVTSGDLILYAVAEGHPSAPAIVLVHGYPDNHRVWDKVADKLRKQYQVIRYDVRGAGRSDKPPRTKDYRLNLLARDLQSVVNAIIPEQAFHLVAHDWGSIQSWESVTDPQLQPRILSYTSISGPCLDHVGIWMRNQMLSPKTGGTTKVLRQLVNSWYVALFQVPVLPELAWKVGLDRLWPNYLKTREQVHDARFSVFQKSDGLHGVKLYRANFLPRLLHPRARHTRCPVQVIIPTRDAYVGTQLTDELVRWTGKLTLQELDAPHWAVLTMPDAIGRLVSTFIVENDRRS